MAAHECQRTYASPLGVVEPIAGRTAYEGMLFGIPSTREDWTDAERSELNRIRTEAEGIAFAEFECNHTDEGDPWCIIHDRATDTIVVHIARINHRYVVVTPHDNRIVKTVILASAVDRALGELRRMAAKYSMAG
jgi:hypothetical protein